MAAPERRQPAARPTTRMRHDAPLVPIAPHRRASMDLARVRRRFAAAIALAAIAMTLALALAERVT
jgi:hypothetical protein